MTRTQARRARIVAAGKLLYGDTRWQSPMARLTGLSPALVQKIADGTRAVTDEVDRKVADALITEAGNRRKAAGKLEEIAGRILQGLE